MEEEYSEGVDKVKPDGGVGVGLALTLRFPSASYFLGLPLFFFPNKSKLPGVVVATANVVVVGAGTAGTTIVVGGTIVVGVGVGVVPSVVLTTFMFMLTFMFIGWGSEDGGGGGGGDTAGTVLLLLMMLFNAVAADSMRVFLIMEGEKKNKDGVLKLQMAPEVEGNREEEGGVGFFFPLFLIFGGRNCEYWIYIFIYIYIYKTQLLSFSFSFSSIALSFSLCVSVHWH